MKRVIDGFKERIEIPKVFYIATSAGGRFIYYINGELRYLHITTELEQAQLLKSHNLIHRFYTCRKGNVIMYVTNTLTVTGLHGMPVMLIREVRAYWSDFAFTADQALEFCAQHEYEKYCQEMGLVGQVIRLCNNIKKSAA